MDFGADISSLNVDNKSPMQLAVASRDCSVLLSQQKEQLLPNTGPTKPTFDKRQPKKPQSRHTKRHDRFEDGAQRRERDQPRMQAVRGEAREQPSLLHLAPAHLTSREQLMKALNSDLVRFAKELEEWQNSTEAQYTQAIGTLEAVVKQLWSTAEVKVFGSYSTKLHLPSSDVDLVLLQTEGSLADLQEVLKTTQGVEQLRLISSAVIPILKVTYRQDAFKLQLDVTLQDTRHRGVRACDLVRTVLSQSWVIKPIFMALKQLFYWVDCHEAYKGGLSSYSLFLMVTCFLQHQRTTNLAETFLATLSYFANDCDYSQPFLVYDPSQPEAYPSLRPVSSTQPQSFSLYVPDPLCTTSNVAHPTNLEPVLGIFRCAYLSLVRPLVCECNKSPLWRMLQEAKAQYQGL
jgi:predicted nucleotidyltransferase